MDTHKFTHKFNCWYSSPIDAGRDLILIDNRGVGSSVPGLDCYEVENASIESLDKQLNKDDIVKLTREVFSACKKRLVEQGIDISQYHLINVAKDLEALRIGLGVGQLNVYGVSYGTRIALEFERLYPDSTRTLILDGIYPQSVKAYENAPRHNSEAMMIRVINKCQKDKGCYDQFGFNLEERLSNFLKHLEENPITIRVTSLVDYSPIEVVVTPDVLFDSLYAMMYDEYAISYIPKYMYASFNGSTDYLTEMVRDYYVNDIVVDSLDEGAYASYSCFDEIPFTDFVAARNTLNKYPFQHSNEYAFATIEAMCEVWNVPAAADEFKEAYKINTPLLIYSGELDPVTPIELAKTVFENARVVWKIEWPNISHAVMLASECADWTAQVFLGDPESDPFVYECSNKKPKFKFEIR